MALKVPPSWCHGLEEVRFLFFTVFCEGSHFPKYIIENSVLVVDDFPSIRYRSLPPEYTLICQAVAFGQGGSAANSHHSNANTFIQLTPMSESAVLSILSGLCGSLLLPQVGQIPSCRGGKRHRKASSQTPWITQPGARLQTHYWQPSGVKEAACRPSGRSWLTPAFVPETDFFPLKSKECRWKVETSGLGFRRALRPWERAGLWRGPAAILCLFYP